MSWGGKYKMSQEVREEDREDVIEGVQGTGTEAAAAVDPIDE